MKKRITALLLSILVLSALTGCGRQTEWDEGHAPSRESETAAMISTPLPAAQSPAPELPVESVEPGNGELVRVQDHLPELSVDLRYAGVNNFTGRQIYDFDDAWLRCGTVKKLAAAQEILRRQGYSLLIWDAYRPQSAQFQLWEVCPDPTYVANPYGGSSSHSNGGTVDITLVTLEGEPVEMPSGFDDFSPLADRDYSDVSQEAGEHARILEQAMTEAGFHPYAAAWWHFSDSDAYPYEDVAELSLPGRDTYFTPNCQESISLRAAPGYDAPVLAQIPKGESFLIFGFAGEFARVSFQGNTGYVALAYIKILER